MTLKPPFDRITIEPGKMDGGQPCLRGLRIPVRPVLEILATYPDRREFLAHFRISKKPTFNRPRPSQPRPWMGLSIFTLTPYDARAVAQLREMGWDGMGCDAIHVREIGMREVADWDIPDRAATEDRVLLTLDRDFPQILALTAAIRPSVVLIRQQRLRAPEIVGLIFSIWKEHEQLWIQAQDNGCVLKSERPRLAHPAVAPPVLVSRTNA